jgi:membrane protein
MTDDAQPGSDPAERPAGDQRAHPGLRPRVDQVAGLAGRAKERYLDHPDSLFGRLGQTDFMDRAMLFAALLMLILFPFLIMVSSSFGKSFSSNLARHMGLDAQASKIVASLFSNGASSSGASTGGFSVLTIVGVLAVISALQGIYEDIFGLPHLGIRSAWRWAVWAVATMAGTAGMAAIGTALDRPVFLGVLSFVLVSVFFWWSMHFLLAGRVPWRELLPAGVATSVFWIGLGIFSSVYFSHNIVANYKRFGSIGVMLLLLSWLIAVGVVIILGAVVGILWWERSYTLLGPLRVARHRLSKADDRARAGDKATTAR